MTVVHWHPPDPIGDVYREACRPDAAPPRFIRARSAIVREMRAEEQRRTLEALERGDTRGGYLAPGAIGSVWGCPILVDDAIPTEPGFEVHRIRPPGWDDPAGARPDAGGYW